MGRDGAGSWGKADDATHWGKVQETESQTNYYVGKQGSGDHCHMWREKDSGETGTKHRGDCKVCDDERSSSDSSSGGK